MQPSQIVSGVAARVSEGVRLCPVSATCTDWALENSKGNRTHLLGMFREISACHWIDWPISPKYAIDAVLAEDWGLAPLAHTPIQTATKLASSTPLQ